MMSFHRKSHRDSNFPRRHWPADESQFFPEWGYGQTGLKAREYWPRFSRIVSGWHFLTHVFKIRKISPRKGKCRKVQESALL
jgi:hypothetical protein